MVIFDPAYIRAFVADRCEYGEEYHVPMLALLKEFNDWARKNGEARTREAFYLHFREATPQLGRGSLVEGKIVRSKGMRKLVLGIRIKPKV